MEISIFDFSHYKPYLIQMLGGYRRRKGLRLAVSKELQCQPTFVSQVLNGSAHFSLEQAEKASRFLGHSEDEQEYFFLLIQKERSGSLGLRNYHEAKIKQLLARRQVLTHRLGKDTALSKEEQAVYYSSWHFAAVHIAVTIPGLRTKERLADFFRLPQKKAAEILQHLITMGLVVEKNSGFEVGRSKIRIGNNSQIGRAHV